MTGKLKGVIAAVTPSGWRRVKASTFVATLGVIMPARWTGRPAGELDGLEAPHDLGEGVGVRLAVVAGDEPGQLLAVPEELLAEGEEDLASGDERHVSPGREGGLGGRDRDVDLGGRRPAARGR